MKYIELSILRIVNNYDTVIVRLRIVELYDLDFADISDIATLKV